MDSVYKKRMHFEILLSFCEGLYLRMEGVVSNTVDGFENKWDGQILAPSSDASDIVAFQQVDLFLQKDATGVDTRIGKVGGEIYIVSG